MIITYEVNFWAWGEGSNVAYVTPHGHTQAALDGKTLSRAQLMAVLESAMFIEIAGTHVPREQLPACLDAIEAGWANEIELNQSEE